MVDVLNTRIKGWSAEMDRKKLKHNIAGCWTAIIINPIWLIVHYFTAPQHIAMIATLVLSVTIGILGLVIFHKKLNIGANQVGLIAILLLSGSSAYMYSNMEVAEFQKVAFSYAAVFIGSGMIVILDMVYSIAIVVINLIFNIIFFALNSPLTIEEFLLNGGLLVALVAIFMVISIQIKYRLTSRGVVSKLILNRNQEELIIAKREAEKSKEMQSQFLSNMSHEIRTPMNGVIGITRVLQNSELTKEQRHYLDAIVKSSENLMVIINDILDFSKIEAGKVVIEKARFNLGNLLSVIQEIFMVKAEEKGIYLTLDLDQAVPEWIIGDSVRLNQILTNLVSNAIKFTEKGGVTIRVALVHSGDENATLWFKVKDTGIGIPEDKLDSVFTSFTQASSSTTRTHGGTGLGLTITKELVELQHGNLWVKSTLDKGSTFHFKLNFGIAQNAEEQEKNLKVLNKKTNDRMLNDLKGIRILLVEDHPINQMLAIKVLEDWNFTVELAENGRIALERVREKDYDLILMDISMPEMDGYTATEEIRSGRHTQHNEIPIIAMTASAFIGDNQKCYKVGMNDYISKPFNPQDLLEKIFRHTLNNQKRA